MRSFARAARTRPDRYLLGISAVAVTLIALMVVSIAGSFATYRAATRSERASRLNNAYQRAATGIAAEESLERKYRLEPGPVPLAAHIAAQDEVREALDDVRRLGAAADQRLASEVTREHAGYVLAATRMFAAVDRGEQTASVNAIDKRYVDPVFSAMQAVIYAAAASHQATAAHQLVVLRHTDHLVLGIDVATLLTGMLLIGATGATLVRSRRRLRPWWAS